MYGFIFTAITMREIFFSCRHGESTNILIVIELRNIGQQRLGLEVRVNKEMSIRTFCQELTLTAFITEIFICLMVRQQF